MKNTRVNWVVVVPEREHKLMVDIQGGIFFLFTITQQEVDHPSVLQPLTQISQGLLGKSQ